MSQPLVSVIIPCFNHGYCIMDAINSVLQQTYKNFEIIIVNDGSDDAHTKEVLDTINNRMIKIFHQKNEGPSVAKNNGISQSKGQFILPLDCDNKLKTDFIKKSVDAMQKNNADIVYTNYQFYGKRNDIYQSIKLNICKLLMFNYIENCSLYKKEVWEANNGYDVLLSKKGLEDWEFWINAAKHESKFFHLDEVLFDYRAYANSRTNMEANKNINDILKYIYKKHSELLSKEFANIYHENKNFKNTIDFKIGKTLLAPMRFFKKYLSLKIKMF